MPHGVHGILMTAGDADLYQIVKVVFVSSSAGKESACNARDPGLIPGSGRSAGEGIGYPLQYSWPSLWLRWKRICLQCERPTFDPWVGKGYPPQYSGLENSMD